MNAKAKKLAELLDGTPDEIAMQLISLAKNVLYKAYGRERGDDMFDLCVFLADEEDAV